MRLLIGFYFLFGIALIALSHWIGYQAIDLLLFQGPGRSGAKASLLLAVILLVTACLPLLIAFGLWKRWQLIRLVLLGLSIWCGIGSLIAGGLAVTSAVGLFDGKELGFDEPLWETLVLVGAQLGFAIWQYWILTRRDVRASFSKAV